MAPELIFAPEAEQDLTESYLWYENRRSGLGEEFLNCIEARIEAILRMPEMYAIAYDTLRRALVRRFPFAVFYRYEKGVLTVYGILHTATDPHSWGRMD